VVALHQAVQHQSTQVKQPIEINPIKHLTYP
jgi:hypothetical protein